MRTRMVLAGIVGLLSVVASLLVASAAARTAAAPAPEAQLLGVTPMHAVVGQRITISGADLDGTTAVTFGSVPATSIVVDPAGNWVRVVVPNGVPTGAVTITLDIGNTPYSTGPIQIEPGSVPAAANRPPVVNSSGGVHPTLRVAPRIVTFSPHRGHAGTKVRITGTNLNGISWVRFGYVQAQIKAESSTAIIAIVPKNARSGKIRLHTAGGTAVSTGLFKVLGSASV